MCFVIDITSIIGLLIEIPGWYPVPARLHAVDEFRAYLVFSVFSAGIILFALIKGKEAAWPRRVLVRFMSLKLPIFLIFCMGYFTISPWAGSLARWVCRNDFQQMRSASGGDYETCVRMFPWLCTLNNAIYIPAYAYTFKASYEWFRCHPSNDNKGIWYPQAASAREGDDYTLLEHGR
mmetsp:Transcript_164592/g.523365  ORF Transcript_164592/g.523365 Transcript_164592/m.523365 type:complete len:178 (+) Transcript_164592:123-656(+)